MNTKTLLPLALLALLLLSACTQSVEEITSNDDYLDKTVRVRGTVESTMKIGELSGYSLVDSQEDKIVVSSNELPEEGSKITAKGTLKKGLLGIGYYIDTKN